MADNSDIFTVEGKAYWAKILGSPKPAYNPGEKEWALDLSLSAEAVAFLTSLGLGHQVKTKGDARGIFCTFQRRELKKKTGKPNSPIEVKDSAGKTWDQHTLLGNGTDVIVKFKVYDVPAFGKKPAHKGYAILSVTVVNLVPYEKKAGSVTAEQKADWKGDIA